MKPLASILPVLLLVLAAGVAGCGDKTCYHCVRHLGSSGFTEEAEACGDLQRDMAQGAGFSCTARKGDLSPFAPVLEQGMPAPTSTVYISRPLSIRSHHTRYADEGPPPAGAAEGCQGRIAPRNMSREIAPHAGT